MTSNAQREDGEVSRAGPAASAGERVPTPETESLAELRSLLLGTELSRIEEACGRIDQPERFAGAVGAVLPRAVAGRGSDDEELTEALQPTVEGALRESVRRNPHVLVDALFPVMGPAIRRAVAAALSEMIQSLNRTLEHSFSIRGLKWRIEAFRTGKSFAEVVLLNSLVYRVEQVFLIHTETGLLLQHVVAPSIQAPDGELVSGMLTAIQDFVGDSLGTSGDEALDAVRVGALTIWIERGSRATLAGVIRGEAPAELRREFLDALDAIHGEHAEGLASFAGDAAPFDRCRPRLEECFQAHYAQEEARPSPALLAVGGILAALLLVWMGSAAWERWKWSDYLERLRGEPGIVVTETGTRGGRFYVAGLQDPLATDPATLLEPSGLDRDDVEGRWDYYFSFEPAFAVERARTLLAPPDDKVSMRMDGRTLVVAGEAPTAWIVEARRLARVVPGVTALDDSALIDADLVASTRSLESLVVRFDTNTDRFSAGQEAELEALVDLVGRINETARRLGVVARYEVTGRADNTGSEATNARLSEERAQRIAAYLAERGLDSTGVVAQGVGTAAPLRQENSPEDAAFNRSVTIRVAVDRSGARQPR
jgi:outer membrane protein OmpA-like peptidoglycan-associated protein